MPCDYSQYPRCWKKISKFLRFYRAAGRCENCGAPHGGFWSDNGAYIVLTVAHLDHNPHNNHLRNLKVLCQRCHLAYDRSHHLSTRRANRRKAKIAAGQIEMM